MSSLQFAILADAQHQELVEIEIEHRLVDNTSQPDFKLYATPDKST